MLGFRVGCGELASISADDWIVMVFRRSYSAVAAAALCSSLVFMPMVKRSDEPEALTNDSLKTTLANMGYEPTDLSKGYLIAIKRDTWTYNMQVVLSNDGTKLGINANLGTVDNPDEISAAQWRTLLEKSEDTDPSYFYYDKDQKKVYLHRVLDNRALSPAYLRTQIENFTVNIHDTADAWNFTK
jgi:hypothetical protein